MLSIDIERKTYVDRGGQAHLALADFRLQVADGEFVCLVGPSGCGKSTLLNLIAGLDTEVQGQVLLSDAAASEPALRPLAEVREGIGFMFQEPRLMPWLSVLDNVLLVAGDDPEAPARARALLRAMELGEVLDAWPSSLSGGMQRRVALARAFVIEPRLLLLDEPFVSLDAPTADRLRTMLMQLRERRRATVVFVTHDLREALALGDRVCFLSAAPARVLFEIRVDLPRPRLPGDAAVAELQQAVLARHPELLAGLAHEAATVAALEAE